MLKISFAWNNEQKVELVIEKFGELEKDEERKVISLSQRFYFVGGHLGIAIDEAYRFLENRWREKQINANRKHTDNSHIEENNNNERSSAGKVLLKKSRIKARVKSNK